MRIFIFLLLLSQTTVGQAETILKASLGQLPAIAESTERGTLAHLLKAYRRAYTEGKIDVVVVPFKRSVENVLSGRADFHGPILKDPKKTDKELGYSLSDASIWTVTFALYVNRNAKPLDVKNLSKYKIETDSAHVGFFDFPIQPSTCLDCSLKKLDAGRIDGFIFAAMECDSIIEHFKLKNIKSVFYQAYEGKFILPLGEKGQATNDILTRLNDRVKKNGEYQKALGPILDYYKNWKPLP